MTKKDTTDHVMTATDKYAEELFMLTGKQLSAVTLQHLAVYVRDKVDAEYWRATWMAREDAFREAGAMFLTAFEAELKKDIAGRMYREHGIDTLEAAKRAVAALQEGTKKTRTSGRSKP